MRTGLPLALLALLAAAGASTALWKSCARAAPPLVSDADEHATPGLERRNLPLPHLVEAAQPVRVRVLLPDGRPAARADVFLEDPELPSERAELFDRQHPAHSLTARLEQLGTRHRTDADGELRVALPTLRLLNVAGRKDGLAASTTLLREDYGPDDLIVLRLQPAQELAVLVTDADGAPQAGIPVGYRSDPLDAARAITLTGADGVARLHALAAAPPAEDGSPFPAVTFAFPCAADAGRRVAPDEFGGAPVPLRLPPLGTVTAEVLDLAGNSAADGTPVLLQEVSPHATSAGRLTPSASIRASRGEARGGVVRFPHVGLGLELELGADFQRAGVYEATRFVGPLEAGEAVHLAVQQRVVLPELRGRVVSESRLPVGERALGLYLIHSGPNGEAREEARGIRTDPSGWFRCAFDAEEDLALAQEVLLVLVAREPGLTLLASATRTAGLGASPWECGDLVLGGPLLVCGESIAPDGGPVRDAYGKVRARGVTPAWQRAIDSIQWLGGGDSRFEIRGPFPAADYEILFSSEGAPGAWRGGLVPFAMGERDCVLPFETRAELRGRLELDEHVPFEALTYRLREGDRMVEGRLSDHSYLSGAFALPLHETDAVVEFEIFGGSQAWPLWRLVDGRREADGTVHLGSVSLEGRLGVARLSVTGGRSALLFPEATRAVRGYETVRNDQVVVFRLDAARCDLLMPGAPLTEIRLQDGVVVLPP